MNKYYLLLLGSVVSLGISNLFFKKSTLTLGPVHTTLWYYLFGFIFSIIIYFVSDKPIITNYTFLKWPLFVAFFLTISVYLFNLSLVKIPISSGATIRSLSFIISVLGSFYFFDDALSYKQILGIFLGTFAIVLMK